MKVKIELPLALWREGQNIVAYTPALELSTFGETEEEAIENFAQAVELFFETSNQRNVTFELLESLGWVYEHSKWTPSSSPIEGSRSYPLEIPLPQAA